MKKNLLVLFLLAFAVSGVSEVFAAGLVEAATVTEQFHLRADKTPLVRKAIVKACEKRGWVVSKETDNEIEAILQKRSYSLTVSISYSNDGYSIAYKDSTGLKYDPEKNRIHSSYARWLKNLNIDINADINLLNG
ncbi:MAG: hypothetical protein LBB93_05270 [Elusimicrobiota bacterium]|nr:hypothetical protein [Elusimicrobiota bacterium]